MSIAHGFEIHPALAASSISRSLAASSSASLISIWPWRRVRPNWDGIAEMTQKNGLPSGKLT